MRVENLDLKHAREELVQTWKDCGGSPTPVNLRKIAKAAGALYEQMDKVTHLFQSDEFDMEDDNFALYLTELGSTSARMESKAEKLEEEATKKQQAAEKEYQDLQEEVAKMLEELLGTH